MKSLEFGDMVFYAITGVIGIILFWLRFLEAAIGLWGAWCVGTLWLLFLVYSFIRSYRARRSESEANIGRKS
jgi:hypothetical protein